MSSVPTLISFQNQFKCDSDCVEYLISKSVFYISFDCPSCSFPMKRYEESFCFRCNRRLCSSRGTRISMRIGTFFHGSALKCIDIMRIAHLWLSKICVKSAILLLGVSSKTICSFYSHFRQLTTSHLNEESQVIGGNGIDVEIDETKLGKRKYHRGHRVEGVWIVVGVERTPERRVFLVSVTNRNFDTLRNIILQHVAPGSNVITDMWKGYSNLESLGLSHCTVNHSLYFKDPMTGACTNTVEGTNNALKMSIPIRNRTQTGIVDHLGEFIWRRQNKDRLFDAFVEALRDIHYDLQ